MRRQIRRNNFDILHVTVSHTAVVATLSFAPPRPVRSAADRPVPGGADAAVERRFPLRPLRRDAAVVIPASCGCTFPPLPGIVPSGPRLQRPSHEPDASLGRRNLRRRRHRETGQPRRHRRAGGPAPRPARRAGRRPGRTLRAAAVGGRRRRRIGAGRVQDAPRLCDHPARNVLVGFIEIKAPGKGADPRRFRDRHDKEQWEKLQSLPNLLYTDGNEFSLWRSGEPVGAVVRLDGDVATSGADLDAPPGLLGLFEDFFRWEPIPPRDAKQLAEISARLCRLLREEVTEQLAVGSPALTALAADWRKLLFPDASDAQFADGYAQAVTFGLLMARARQIPLGDGLDHVARQLGQTQLADRQRPASPDGRRGQPGDAEDLAGHAHARPRRRPLAGHQQGRSRRLALLLRAFPGGLRQRAAQADRLVLHAARRGRRDGPAGGRGAAQPPVQPPQRPGLAGGDGWRTPPSAPARSFSACCVGSPTGWRPTRGRAPCPRRSTRPSCTSHRIRDPARAVRRRPAARPRRAGRPHGRRAGHAAADVRHRHAGQPLRRAGVDSRHAGADRGVAAAGERRQAAGADHGRDRQPAVQGEGQGPRRLGGVGKRETSAGAAPGLDAAARMGRRRARQAPAQPLRLLLALGDVEGVRPRPARPTRESSASSRWPASSTGRASRRCATTCAARPTTSG